MKVGGDFSRPLTYQLNLRALLPSESLSLSIERSSK